MEVLLRLVLHLVALLERPRLPEELRHLEEFRRRNILVSDDEIICPRVKEVPPEENRFRCRANAELTSFENNDANRLSSVILSLDFRDEGALRPTPIADFRVRIDVRKVKFPVAKFRRLDR